MRMRSPNFWRALRFAMEGIVYMVRTQRNARIHLVILFLVIVAGILLKVTLLEWGLIVVVSGLVLSLEAVNSGIEALVDMVQPDHHPLAKAAKDAAAGAVLLAAIAAVGVGLIVFGPRVWTLIQPLANPR